MSESFSMDILIDAKPSKVWTTLTDLNLMAQWMGEPEMNLKVQTNWELNAPIYFRGFHHIQFENKGIVFKYIREQRLSYSHLSSVSRLPDKIDNYALLEFVLTLINNQTNLTINISKFPTGTIQKHLVFYWRGTIHKLKRQAEMDVD